MFVEGKPRTVFFLQTLYFTAFIATVEKIITYALGEHDPGSAQDWRTSNDFFSPAYKLYPKSPGKPLKIAFLRLFHKLL